MQIHAEPTNGTCSACGEQQRVVAVTIGATTSRLCRECGDHAATTIQDKLSILDSSVPSHDEVTSSSVASFATYPRHLLLDELVMCAVNYRVGPLDADKRRIATALLERLATLGLARKVHRAGCEIWTKYRLCDCPWDADRAEHGMVPFLTDRQRYSLRCLRDFARPRLASAEAEHQNRCDPGLSWLDDLLDGKGWDAA